MKILQGGGVTSAAGFSASFLSAGIKKSGKPDLALLISDVPAQSVCATTKNLLCAAPVKWCRSVMQNGSLVKGVIVNSGNANAATGEEGMLNCKRMAELTAAQLGCEPLQIYVCSTGVIGRQLPMDKVEAGISSIKKGLSNTQKAGDDFSRAILTTDLVQKQIAVTIEIGGKTVTVGGCCKGSGMIHPNMATMLAYSTTDAVISKDALKMAFENALKLSFNRITVDGDTSTNDTLMLFANGAAANNVIKPGSADFKIFSDALVYVFTELAKMVVRDGEGATKFVSITVKDAPSENQADKAARSIAHSPLVKTALFGNDPNCMGRIMAALGYSGAEINPDLCHLTVAGIKLVKSGTPLKIDVEAAASHLKSTKDIDIVIECSQGASEATIYTCDFSYDYVKINAEYTT
ncbi:MAG: bifunctional glutamate N-acetyltransferase/amino-acid acetyltransferase ArgJ [Fibrobacteres bacterium]|nr:bifunctional glutamate N-acetyltransferase/amino-acid acetyltransferase ArgJ [Fibrobacterota bacterium]